MARARVGLGAAEDFDPVDQRKLEVQEDHAGAVFDLPVRIAVGAEDEFERFGPVADDLNVIGNMMRLEGVHRELHVVGIVFDEQNFDSINIHWRELLPRA